MLNWETFQNAYQRATPEQRAIVDSTQIPTAVDNTLPQLPNHSRKLVIRAVALLALGAGDAAPIAEELNQKDVNIDSATLNALAGGLRGTVAQPSAAVSSVRTMAGDAAAAQSDSLQSTSQDDLLKKSDQTSPGIGYQ